MGRKGNSKKRHVTKRKFLTFIYTGYILEEKFQNYPHGSGKAFYNDGTIYEGLFSYGKREGLGKLEYNDGSIYYGLFRDDLKLLKNLPLNIFPRGSIKQPSPDLRLFT